MEDEFLELSSSFDSSSLEDSSLRGLDFDSLPPKTKRQYNFKYPCSSCEKPCKSNQKCILCDSCNLWIHLSCSDLSLAQYEYYSNATDDDFPYQCPNCTHQSDSPSTISNSVPFIINSTENNFILSDSSNLSQDYFDICSINSLTANNPDPNSILVLHVNSVSLCKHHASLTSLISKFSHPPSIICVSETRLQNDKLDFQLNFVEINGYNFVYDNSKLSAGGTAIYIKDNLKFIERTDIKLNIDDCEACFIEILCDGPRKNPLIGVIYRHPTGNIKLFNHLLGEFLENLEPTVGDLTILGDINIDVLNPNSNCVDYCQTLDSLGLSNLINIPTRISRNMGSKEVSKTAIDHIISNIDGSRIKTGVINFDFSDHLPIFALLNFENPKRSSSDEYVYKRCFSESKSEVFADRLNNIMNLNTVNFDNGINHALSQVIDLSKQAINDIFPFKKCKTHKAGTPEKPWMSFSEVKKSDKAQLKLWQKFIKCGVTNSQDHIDYKRQRNLGNRIKEKSRNEYFDKQFEKANNDRRKTWNVINELTKTKSKKKVYPDFVQTCTPEGNVSECSSKSGIANEFNSHFSLVGEKLNDQLPDSPNTFQDFLQSPSPHKDSIFLHKITEAEVFKLINEINVNKSVGVDEIPPKVLKWGIASYTPLLTKLFNACFLEGVYPDQLKVAKVVPIFKGGDKNDVNSYRPISILSQINRIFEKIIYDRLYSFLVEKNNILHKKQFGFQPGHSTEHAMLDMKEHILRNMDKKLVSCLLFLDLKKAFDSVNHSILLKKLSYYGIRGTALNLLASYLSNRYQTTCVDGFSSILNLITWGVPQGSVLGPLLFLVFINDLPNVSNLLSTWLFADDSAFCHAANSMTILETEMNCEIAKVQNWLLANRLSVHYIKKSQFMLIDWKSTHSEINSIDDFTLEMGGHPLHPH